jgi:hypothetical protein
VGKDYNTAEDEAQSGHELYIISTELTQTANLRSKAHVCSANPLHPTFGKTLKPGNGLIATTKIILPIETKRKVAAMYFTLSRGTTTSTSFVPPGRVNSTI